MGTRLHKLKARTKGQKLADGKTMSGKGRLTDTQIDRIQSMYGVAIRANKHNLAKMKENVWAIFFHKLSADKNPMLQMCTETCPNKRAKTENIEYQHKNSLPQVVMDQIKPVFRDLADPGLLEKCVDGYTQNANESFNNNSWSGVFVQKAKTMD